MSAPIDLRGRRFGRLTVIKRAAQNTQNGQKAQWYCRCDCGTETVVVSGNLRNGFSTSCGCFHRERLIARNRSRRIESIAVDETAPFTNEHVKYLLSRIGNVHAPHQN